MNGELWGFFIRQKRNIGHQTMSVAVICSANNHTQASWHWHISVGCPRLSPTSSPALPLDAGGSRTFFYPSLCRCGKICICFQNGILHLDVAKTGRVCMHLAHEAQLAHLMPFGTPQNKKFFKKGRSRDNKSDCWSRLIR